MRVSRLNLTTVPYRFFQRDERRSIIILRNQEVSTIAHMQFGSGGDLNDGFDIKPGDTFTIDTQPIQYIDAQGRPQILSKIPDEIFCWADAPMSNFKALVG